MRLATGPGTACTGGPGRWRLSEPAPMTGAAAKAPCLVTLLNPTGARPPLRGCLLSSHRATDQVRAIRVEWPCVQHAPFRQGCDIADQAGRLGRSDQHRRDRRMGKCKAHGCTCKREALCLCSIPHPLHPSKDVGACRTIVEMGARYGARRQNAELNTPPITTPVPVACSAPSRPHRSRSSSV